MQKTMTLRRIGGSLGGTLPKEVVDRLNVREGDKLFVVEREDGVLLTPYSADFAEAMEQFDEIRREFRNAFRELAK
ncbi:MAG TPA: AbrB/MazE/SpoVT family DNA-binding domain-containing protein [Longimicrobiaceae bacterium]|nr:AbrB/MazE/SpoVT family DNA-binding domain-containing protein [Longimicrobiaceae bacterium]